MTEGEKVMCYRKASGEGGLAVNLASDRDLNKAGRGSGTLLWSRVPD